MTICIKRAEQSNGRARRMTRTSDGLPRLPHIIANPRTVPKRCEGAREDARRVRAGAGALISAAIVPGDFTRRDPGLDAFAVAPPDIE
jgi:hypothetical protein